MTNEPTNADRAQWAGEAIAVFTARTYGGDHPGTMDEGDLETAVSDLIADLLHYAKRQGFDADTVLTRACEHFECELAEEVQS